MLDHKYILYCQSNGNGKSYLAIGMEDSLVVNFSGNAFDQLDEFLKEKNSWVFGCFSYDLKNEIEDLQSKNSDGVEMPEMIFFRPKMVLEIEKNEYKIRHNSTDYSQQKIDDIFNKSQSEKTAKNSLKEIRIESRTSKKEYLKNAAEILDHIQKGDIYELNYCQEFFVENITLSPWETYQSLNDYTKAPYACFMRWEDQYVLSGSPELFLEKKGSKIISKPIKGTIRRGANSDEDELLKIQLRNDKKERAENVMIVDIVRNDLSRTAKKSSVKVEELCEIYSYETVHQMISTVVSEKHPERTNVEVLKYAFPMGSMTGAPKIRAMELIEKFEDFKRGIYSGAIGYFEPNGDFTFNVVIRSILYDAKNKYCSYSAGGALTALSVPKNEYEESLLKAEAMKKSIVENAR